MHILLFYTSTLICTVDPRITIPMKISFFNPRSVFCLNTDCVSTVCLPESTCACLVAQLYLTLCDPMDYCPPDSSAHGIFQARILEWVTIPFSKESSQFRNQTQVPCIAGGFFIISATREAQMCIRSDQIGSVAQSCPTLCHPMNRSMPGLPVHHQLPEFTQTHVHRVSDAIQPSHPLLSPSPPAPNPSQHQSLFQ